MRVTANNIAKAIKSTTGYDVGLYHGKGYYYFYSDDDETALMIAGFNTASVYTYRMSWLTIEQWVGMFENMLADYFKYRSGPYG